MRTTTTLLARIIEEYGKMAFVSGPRQVGKTTLAKAYGHGFGPHTYFNWDVITDQRRFAKDPYFFAHETREPSAPALLILDEIHKYARWKNYLKGAYDRYHADFRFLVTGSGRLDMFKRGGDSLLGRYMNVPLFPFTVGELLGRVPSPDDVRLALEAMPPVSRDAKVALEALGRYSGFPEPLVRANDKFYGAWFAEYKTLLIREDIRTAAVIRELSLMEILSHLLPERVASPLSINSLREDIGVAFETVRDWILLLERFYYLHRVLPYARTIARAIKKQAKVYLYNWVEVPVPGARFENLVAMHMLKTVRLWRAMGEGEFDLHYVRDKEKREVDFLITAQRKPWCLVECTLEDESPASALRYYQEKLSVPWAVQVVQKSGVCRKFSEGARTCWVVSADRWLATLA
jgi:predicted AAA+ superfamily ATPase